MSLDKKDFLEKENNEPCKKDSKNPEYKLEKKENVDDLFNKYDTSCFNAAPYITSPAP